MAFEEATPKELGEWCRAHGAFAQDYLIYSGRKDGKTVQLVCTHCGARRIAKRMMLDYCRAAYQTVSDGFTADLGDGEIDYTSGDEIPCPDCGKVVKVLWGRQVEENMRIWQDAVWPMWVDCADGVIRMRGWGVWRHFDRNGQEYFKAHLTEMYKICRDGKKLQMTRYSGVTRCMSGMRMHEPEPRKRCADMWHEMDASLLRLENPAGTLAENAHLREYAEAAESIWPVSYMRLWIKHPWVECLLTAGAGALLAEMIQDAMQGAKGAIPKLPDVSWKKKRPGEMLGLDRQEFRQAVQEEWTATDLLLYRYGKAGGETDIRKLRVLFGDCNKWTLREMEKEDQPLKIAKYLYKQKAKSRNARAVGWRTLCDTWDMAKKQGLDLQDPAVRWPKDLMAYHDRLVDNQQFIKDQRLMGKFTALAKQFAPAATEWDGICIRIAASEKELRQEGAALKNCVGTYGDKHVEGNCIFFVRRAEAPDVPWYTLQVNTRTGQQLQLHGYRNDFEHPVPQEVRDFLRRVAGKGAAAADRE